MGRDKIPNEDKKKQVRLSIKQSIIDDLTLKKVQQIGEEAVIKQHKKLKR